MSAFMVSKTHIDALITAGLRWGLPHRTRGPVRWLHPELTDEDKAGAYQRGEPWGPEAVRLTRERTHELTRESAGRVGAMLLAENRASVDHRYAEEEWEQPYEFEAVPGDAIDPVVVLSLIRCYEYQSCEHPEWEASEAHAFCEALTVHAIAALPGYGDAPWTIGDEDRATVFTTARRRAA